MNSALATINAVRRGPTGFGSGGLTGQARPDVRRCYRAIARSIPAPGRAASPILRMADG